MFLAESNLFLVNYIGMRVNLRMAGKKVMELILARTDHTILVSG